MKIMLDNSPNQLIGKEARSQKSETWQQWAARTCPLEHKNLIADRINAMTAKTNADRQRAYREQQTKLGRRQRLKYLTDEENSKVDAYIKRLRKAQ